MATPRRKLVDVLERLRPDLADAVAAIEAGAVRVDGAVVTNPSSLVRPSAAVAVVSEVPLRGEAKLIAALESFSVDVAGRIALDAGAAAGGFTRTLLRFGATKVYAVDAGHGQLLGSLRQDQRVVNLEATNISQLDRHLVPDVIEIVTMDLSYLSIAAALPALSAVELAPAVDLVALVKPMFELRRPTAPNDRASLDAALESATGGLRAAGWQLVDAIDSPVVGARGAKELLVHARRAQS